jgi:hypothetical protein
MKTESLFRQYAREMMDCSEGVKPGEKDIFAGLAYTFALAALIEEKLEFRHTLEPMGSDPH